LQIKLLSFQVKQIITSQSEVKGRLNLPPIECNVIYGAPRTHTHNDPTF